MIDIWQLHSRLGITVEIPHLICGVLKDKAMFSVKPQRTQGMRRERKNRFLLPLGRIPYLGRNQPCLHWGSLWVTLVCAQSVIFLLFFVFLTCSAVSTFWIANPHNNLINCAAAGSEVSAQVSYLVTAQASDSPAKLREALTGIKPIFKAAWLRHTLMWLVPPIKRMVLLLLQTSCHLMFLELDLTKFHSVQPE